MIVFVVGERHFIVLGRDIINLKMFIFTIFNYRGIIFFVIEETWYGVSMAVETSRSIVKLLEEERRVVVEWLSACNDIVIHHLLVRRLPNVLSVKSSS